MRKNEIKEGLGDLAHAAERDHEVQMARADLYKIAKYAIQLHEMLKSVSEAEGIEGWQQSKITKAADYLSSVYHAMDYETKLGNGQAGVVNPEMANESYKETLARKLAERAVSTDQRRAAAIALRHKKEGTKPQSGSASESMMSMSVAELEKMSSGSEKDLPKSVD